MEMWVKSICAASNVIFVQKFPVKRAITRCLEDSEFKKPSVRDGEDFGGVRKESQFYSNELYSHLKV
jgi:hypothetical protein